MVSISFIRHKLISISFIRQKVISISFIRQKVINISPAGAGKREVACSTSDRQGLNFETCVSRALSSHSSHHPQEILLAQFSLHMHKGSLKAHSFHFISQVDEHTIYTHNSIASSANLHSFSSVICPCVDTANFRLSLG